MISPSPNAEHHQHGFQTANNGASCQTSSNTASGKKSNNNMNGSASRYKSLSNFQTSLSNCTDGNIDSGNLSSGGRYSPHPNEIFIHHQVKLSLKPANNQKIDDSLSCCLPPPSPAPHNDRFVDMENCNGAAAASGVADAERCGAAHHYQYQQQMLSSSTSTSSLSPNTNISSSMGTCARNLSSTHSLQKYSGSSTLPISASSPNSYHRKQQLSAKTTQLGQATTNPMNPPDNYSYLTASTAHTPIKRYVPTPPPSHESYQSDYIAPLQRCGPTSGNLAPHLCTLPHRLRLKCCNNEQNMLSTAPMSNPSSVQLDNSSNYYSPSTRARSIDGVGFNGKYNMTTALSPPKTRESPDYEYSQNQSLNGNSKANASGAPSTGLCSQQASICVQRHDFNIQTINAEQNNSNVFTTGSNTSRILSPIIMNNSDIVNISGSSAATCLHCNTSRRTTGVHQTTQTTGPISPVPQLQLSGNNQTTQEQFISAIFPNNMAPSAAIVTNNTTSSNLKETFANQSLPSEKKSNGFQSAERVGEPSVSNMNGGVGKAQQQMISTQQLVPSSGHLQRHPKQNKKCITQYINKTVSRFFGVDSATEAEEYAIWQIRQRRLAARRFGEVKSDQEMMAELQNPSSASNLCENNGVFMDSQNSHRYHVNQQQQRQAASERPDILPAQDDTLNANFIAVGLSYSNLKDLDFAERKAPVTTMIYTGITYILNAMLNRNRSRSVPHQWSRSFAPTHIQQLTISNEQIEDEQELCENLTSIQEDEVFFDSANSSENGCNSTTSTLGSDNPSTSSSTMSKSLDRHQLFVSERMNGWRTSALMASAAHNRNPTLQSLQPSSASLQNKNGLLTRGTRISAQLLDGVLENSRRPATSRSHHNAFRVEGLDDRMDFRPFFTYWINTVQILVLILTLLCYGIGPIGLGTEQRTGQVLVTSLSLQTVQHSEHRNIWIGPRNYDLVHVGAKFASCMRRDVKVIDVLLKTRRQERETACCIRNDDSGCVQSSQADCSVRGLFPTKSLSTWKKWSPGESGPGGRISGSVCGLDPKYCDAPASIAPYEWPDDITKWPICRKSNAFTQRYRYKDHTAEHMICEVIGHPCCTGAFGECRIATREYCDFVNGYFHEEASLCSQISCLNNVCGMFPFLSVEVPDQFYRLFTSLCLHAGILHLLVTVAFQHVFLSDLERFIGPLRTAIIYIGSGIAGNLASAVLVPYKPEVGPLASLLGVAASLIVLLMLIHWKQLRKPYLALLKLLLLSGVLFAMGTLPWQLNFVGSLTGVACGVSLTLTLVPFVSIRKYGRKSKIRLIWSCVLFHGLLYTLMLVIFYVFPAELTNFKFEEIFVNKFSSSSELDNFKGNPNVLNTNDVITNSLKGLHHHHHSENIVTSNAAAALQAEIKFNVSYLPMSYT